jgi:uncharacterized repeat protein (TIGR03803 family)
MGRPSGAGAANSVTVYELGPPVAPNADWTERVLYSFTGGEDESLPNGTLVFDALGNLYGTTEGGGSQNCDNGCGTVFELSPPTRPGAAWTESVLYRFTGGSDGGAPDDPVIFDPAGTCAYCQGADIQRRLYGKLLREVTIELDSLHFPVIHPLTATRTIPFGVSGREPHSVKAGASTGKE